MKKFLLLTILFSFCFSCRPFIDSTPEGWPLIEPRPARGTRGFPPAKGNYGIGFRDGCGMAWDAVTKGLTSDVAPKDLKPDLAANNADYQTGWFDGFEQCTYIVDWDVV